MRQKVEGSRTKTATKQQDTEEISSEPDEKQGNLTVPLVNGDVTKKTRKRRASSTATNKKTKRTRTDREALAIAGPSNKVVKGKRLTATGSKKAPKTIQTKSAPQAKVKVDTVSKAASRRQKDLIPIPQLPTIAGVLFVIGDNEVGQLGLGENIHLRKRPAQLDFPLRFVDIAAGGMHSVCLTEKGEVYTFGCNDEGALGRNTEDEDGSEHIPKKVNIPEVVVRVSAGDSHSAAITENGHIYIWGNFRSGDGSMGLITPGVKHTLPVQILKSVIIVAIASGSEHLACLSNNGLVYTCGSAEVGQLGRITERSCKGDSRKGLGAFLEPGIVPLRVPGHRILCDEVWTGSYSTFVKVKKTGEIYAFGLNNCGQLGFMPSDDERSSDTRCSYYRPTEVTSFIPALSWQHISGGQHHTLALNYKGEVYSLGRKEYGRLGLGEDCTDKSSPTQIPTLETEKCTDISSGNVVSFSVTENGSVYSWGMGTNHQLGHGGEDDCHVPRLIEGDFQGSWHAFKVSGGGQHTLILANRKASTNGDPKSNK